MKTNRAFLLAVLLGVVGLAISVNSQTTFTIQTYDSSSAFGGPMLDATFGLDESGGNDYTLGQTFRIDNLNARITQILLPVYVFTNATLQLGVAAWNGSQPSGTPLYLSDQIYLQGTNGWGYVSVGPTNLTLNRGQEYLFFLTPNAFLNSFPSFDAVPGSAVTQYTNGVVVGLGGHELSVNDLFAQSWNGASTNGMAFSIQYQEVPEPDEPCLLCFAGMILWLWVCVSRSGTGAHRFNLTEAALIADKT